MTLMPGSSIRRILLTLILAILGWQKTYAQSYCRPALGSCCEWISNVSIGSINNNTTNEPGHADYTSLSTVVTKGTTYPISIKISTNSIYVEHVKVYFDWGRDYTFESFLYLGSGKFTGHKVFTGEVAVPSNATEGCSMMRVFMQYAQSPAGACTSDGDGEVEDYTLIVTKTSVPVADFSFPSSVCSGVSVSFTNNSAVSDGGTLNYLWNFGDGTTSTVASPVKTFSSPGTYAVKLAASTFCTTHSVTKSITVNSTSIITTQPSDVTICAGSNATFTLGSSGHGNTFQWQVNSGNGFVNINNGGAYSNASSSALQITGATSSMNGYQYRCLVTNTCTTISSTTTLTVSMPPVITSQPVNASVCPGGTATYSVAATSSGLTYQWQENSGNGFTTLSNNGRYSTVTTNTLYISEVTAALNDYQYRCVITGPCPSVSSAATLTVNTLAIISKHPTSAIIIAGSDTSFHIDASGSELTYQWQENSGSGYFNLSNNSIYRNVTTATLNIDDAALSFNGRLYRCIVSGTCAPAVTSNAALLTLNSPVPIITSSPITIVNEDIIYTYTVTATSASGNHLTYSAPEKPAWLSFDPVTHILRGTPTNSDVGIHHVTLYVNNGITEAVQSFSITVANTNDAPTILSSPATMVNEGSAYTYTLDASDVDSNDVLTYLLPILPEWLTFDPATGVLYGTPSHKDVGNHPIILKVSDGMTTVEQKFTLAVLDITKPTVLISGMPKNLTNSSFPLTVVFSETVSDFTASDLGISNGTSSSFSVVNDSTYSFLISPYHDGEVRVNVPSNAAHDFSSNGNVASSEFVQLYDGTAPTISLSTNIQSPGNKPFLVKFLPSEEVADFEYHDIVVSNAAISNLQNEGAFYSAVVTPASTGIVRLEIAQNSFVDLAGNENETPAFLEFAYDNIPPAGYQVQFGVDLVDVNNVNDILFAISEAEVGTRFFYSIISNNNSVVKSGSGEVKSALFSVAGLDLIELADGDLTLTLHLIDEAGNQGDDVITHVQKITRNVVSVAPADPIHIPVHTAATQITLPSSVEVTYSNDEKEFIGVVWTSAERYDEIGLQTLPGKLMLAPLTTNINNIQAALSLLVSGEIGPTKISLSNTIFDSSISSSEIIGTFTTVDQDNTDHNYQLVSGEGDVDNDLFKIIENGLYLKSNQELDKAKQFTIRVRSINSFGNSIDSVFSLEKSEPEENRLTIQIPNTFSPDGDGINDKWIIKDLKNLEDVTIQVFDRSGVQVYNSTDPAQGWDGSVGGGKILEGPFFYIVRIKEVIKKGVLIAIR